MSKKFIKSERRSFLKGAVVAGGAAATGSALAQNTPEAPVAEDPLKSKVKGDKGYEENDYIRNYYDRARF